MIYLIAFIAFAFIIYVFTRFEQNAQSRIYKDGFDAGVSGIPLDDCPYGYYEVNKRSLWVQGHCAGWAVRCGNQNNKGDNEQ